MCYSHFFNGVRNVAIPITFSFLSGGFITICYRMGNWKVPPLWNGDKFWLHIPSTSVRYTYQLIYKIFVTVSWDGLHEKLQSGFPYILETRKSFKNKALVQYFLLFTNIVQNACFTDLVKNQGEIIVITYIINGHLCFFLLHTISDWVPKEDRAIFKSVACL